MLTCLIPFLNRYSFLFLENFLNFISRRIFRNFIFCRKPIHPGIWFFSCDCVCLWNLFLFLSEMLLANYLRLGNGLIVFLFLPLLVILGIHLSLDHLNHLTFPDLNIADNKHIISQIPIATDHLNFNPKQIVISFIVPHVTTRLNTQLISNKTIVNIITDNVFLFFINSLLII